MKHKFMVLVAINLLLLVGCSVGHTASSTTKLQVPVVTPSWVKSFIIFGKEFVAIAAVDNAVPTNILRVGQFVEDMTFTPEPLKITVIRGFDGHLYVQAEKRVNAVLVETQKVDLGTYPVPFKFQIIEFSTGRFLNFIAELAP